MKIAKLEPSQHKTGRWLVWLEDGALLRVSEGDVVSLTLYTGKELDRWEAEELECAAERSKLNERALDLLSARPMSRKELLDKLTAPRRRSGSGRKGRESEPERDPEEREREREKLRDMAEKVCDRMEELGLLNDREYAAAVARRYAAKGYGPRKLRDELYRRGVSRMYWEEALAGAAPEEEGQEVLDCLLEKKLRGAEPTRENLKRASDYLARRGFGWSEISEAIGRYRENQGSLREEWD